MRLPTITPSASSATVGRLLGGRDPEAHRDRHLVAPRTRATVSASPGGSSSRSPVIPVSDTV